MTNINEKYQKRLEKDLEDRRMGVNQPELGNFTFEKAVKWWPKSDQFKDLGINGTLFNAQYEVARMLKSYFTEEQWKNVPMHKLEKELLQFINEKLLPAEDCNTKCEALRRFITYVNDKQFEKGYALILRVAMQRTLRGNSKQEELNGNK